MKSKTEPLEIPVRKLKKNQFISFHHELFSSAETAKQKIRVCIDINFRCFWIGVDGQYYAIDTQDLMNLLIPQVIALHNK